MRLELRGANGFSFGGIVLRNTIYNFGMLPMKNTPLSINQHLAIGKRRC
jgi:hypothetical protein